MAAGRKPNPEQSRELGKDRYYCSRCAKTRRHHHFYTLKIGVKDSYCIECRTRHDKKRAGVIEPDKWDTAARWAMRKL